jgi:hypothetical protein
LPPDAEWTEAEGFPYAGTFVGPDAIIAGVFQRMGTERIGYRADVYTSLRTTIVSLRSAFTPAPTRRPVNRCGSAFAHLYALREGKILGMTHC